MLSKVFFNRDSNVFCSYIQYFPIVKNLVQIINIFKSFVKYSFLSSAKPSTWPNSTACWLEIFAGCGFLVRAESKLESDQAFFSLFNICFIQIISQEISSKFQVNLWQIEWTKFYISLLVLELSIHGCSKFIKDSINAELFF